MDFLVRNSFRALENAGTAIGSMTKNGSIAGSEFIARHQAAGSGEKSSFWGLLVAAYSVGQFISSPLAGFWFNRRGAREPILWSLVLLVFSNLLYALAWNPWILLWSRVIVGLGAG